MAGAVADGGEDEAVPVHPVARRSMRGRGFRLQDSPGVRVTYVATIRVPAGLTAVMAAESRVQPDERRKGMFRFVHAAADPVLI